MTSNLPLFAGWLALLALGSDDSLVPLVSKADESRIRQPVAVVASRDGSRLFVANRRSGSLSIVDPKQGRVVAEFDLAKSFADLATLPDGRLLAVDRARDALLVLKPGDRSIEVEARLSVAADPASVLASPDGSMAVVASTASHRVSVINLSEKTPKVERVIPLPFAPGLLAWADLGKSLVVADAFGGQLGVVDPSLDHPVSVRSIPAHNIRGLARTPDGGSLVVAHQTLNKLARTSFEDVHWGSLIGNHLRILKLANLLDPQADPLKGSKVIDLGGTGRAAGDPGALGFDVEGRLTVALAGVDEVACFSDLRSTQPQRVAVGRTPSAVLATPEGSRVYVLGAGDDSISVIDSRTARKVGSILLGPRPELDAVARGERLFADARLSHDGWMSCQSCHTDGQSNGLSVDTLSDGGFGAPKRVTSLLGVGSTGPWTWLGTTDRLEDQVRKSIETTMRGRPASDAQVNDLTAYLRSLPPPRIVDAEATEAVERGRAVFRSRKCAECHAPPGYTTDGAFDVGLADEVGHHSFNPPSLRGVGQSGPYFHDGRAATLPDVFLRHRHPRGSNWSEGEVNDLTTFLRTL